MLRIAFQTCLTVMALLISASVTVAAECGYDDPKTCSNDLLCFYATAGSGQKTWTSRLTSQVYVEEAKKRLLSCT